MSDSALLSTAKASDVTIIADVNHGDEGIPAHVQSQLQAMYDSGVRHLYLEHDPIEETVETQASRDDAYGRMVAEAQRIGFEIHLYDERSLQRAVDARYPEAAQYLESNYDYHYDPAAMIASAPDPDQMREYLAARREAMASPERDQAMIRNIDQSLKAHPGERAVVMLGAGHLDENDVDEGLRARGHQVTTLQIHTEDSRGIPGNDLPDIIASAETGEAVMYKPLSPAAVRMIPLRDGEFPPSFRREETAPLSPEESAAPPHPMAGLLGGFSAGAFASCHTDGQHYCPSETGGLAAATVQDKTEPQRNTSALGA